MGHSGEGGALLSTNSRGSRSLLKGCNIAKKHPATTPKKHPATTPKKGGYSHNDRQMIRETRRARHHTTVCVPRGGLNSPTSDATKSAVLPPRLTDGSSRHPRPDRSPNQSGSSGLNSPKSEWTCTKSAVQKRQGCTSPSPAPLNSRVLSPDDMPDELIMLTN